MVRISIPTLPKLLTPYLNPHASFSLQDASSKLATFLRDGNGRTLVITGAGVSVDSGIRAYRGEDGRYTNPNFRPVYYGELVDPSPVGESFRKRYWSRGYVGWDSVRDAEPNPVHYGVAAMMWMGLVREIVTQNVDGLHNKASPWSEEETARRILALHGTLHLVHCKNKHTVTREDFHQTLSKLNPSWKAFKEEAIRTGTQPRTNPDGDADLGGISFDSFEVPPCSECGSIVKPDVVFFGESIADEVKRRAAKAISDSSQVLILGTSLATYSAFTLIRQAQQQSKPVLMITLGPSRADGEPGVERIDLPAGPVLRGALAQLSEGRKMDETLKRLLSSGVVRSPDEGTTSSTKDP